MSTRGPTRVVNRPNTSILYLGLVSTDYIPSNWWETFEIVSFWSHVRRCAMSKGHLEELELTVLATSWTGASISAPFRSLRTLSTWPCVYTWPDIVPGECLRHQLYSWPPEVDEEEDHFFFFLAFFPFDEETALASDWGLGLVENAAAGEW
jgi:hypothetical protein